VEKGGLHVQGVMGFVDLLEMTGCVDGVVVSVSGTGACNIIGDLSPRWPWFQAMVRSMNKGDVFSPAACKASEKRWRNFASPSLGTGT